MDDQRCDAPADALAQSVSRRALRLLALPKRFTHLAGTTIGLLFYNATTGRGIGCFLSTAGAWTKTTTYG